jgi:hypothetical protein
MITIIITLLGLVETNIFSARISHTMLGFFARLAVSEYGLKATSETLSSKDITVGGVLRVVIMRAALQGEDSITVRLDVAFRMLRYTFPLVYKNAPDRLCLLNLEIYEKLIIEICILYKIQNYAPFVNAIRYEIRKVRKTEKAAFTKDQKKRFGSIFMDTGRKDAQKEKSEQTEQMEKMKHRSIKTHISDTDGTVDNTTSNKQERLLQRVHNLPQKTRKLLLTASKNKNTLKNLCKSLCN